MTVMARPTWLRWLRKPPEPSPIPAAAEETNRIAREVSRVVDQLRRMNDVQEGRLRDER